MIDALVVLGNAVAVAAALAFTVTYSFSRWEKSSIGRSVMALALSVLILGTGRLLANFVHYETGQWFMLFAWPAIAAVMTWSTVRMWKLNHSRDPIDNPS